jgi:dihydroorotate dehydrogenase (NAD+) catalytic subunit
MGPPVTASAHRTVASVANGRAAPPSFDEGVELAGVELAHPVLNGSGTFDAVAALRTFGPAVIERFPFAAFVSKTITLEPRGGNPPPRLWETPAGLINSIGLPNKGLAGFLEQDLPELVRLRVPLIVSVAATSHEEFGRLVSGVAARPEVAALELNVSCPNVESGCIMGSNPAETAALLAALRPLTAKPLIVKLTPNVGDIGAVAEAAADAGADALSLINTLRGAALHPDTGRPWLGGGGGGLSGASVRTVALALIQEVASRVSLPLVGMGGIGGGRDALDFMAAGATCVAVGTESFRDPTAGARVRAELRELVSRRNLRSFREVPSMRSFPAPAKVPATNA